jgi:transcriptional regulator with XRE-family HTH domain
MPGRRQALRIVRDADVGAQLRARRVADELTQADLGERFGVRQQTIGAWERGERPHARFLVPIADYLGLESSVLQHLFEQAEQAAIENSARLSESCEADATTMRAIADAFVRAQEQNRKLTREETDIYRGFIEYFSDRIAGGTATTVADHNAGSSA